MSITATVDGTAYSGVETITVGGKSIALTESGMTLQDKTVTPTASQQVVQPDDGYGGLRQVTVNGDADLVGGNIKKNVEIFGVIGTYEGIGEFSQYSYVDVQTADQTLLSVTNPLGVIPKLVLIKALTNPNDTSKIGTGMFDPLCGVAYDYELPTSYNAVYAYSPVDTLGTTTHTYVLNASTFAARRYSAGYTWDTSVTYRVYFYA